MRWIAPLLFLCLAGCSTAPIADMLDFFSPGRLGPEETPPYGGVCGPRPVPGFPCAGPVPASAPPPGPPPIGPATAPPPLASPPGNPVPAAPAAPESTLTAPPAP